MDAGTGGGGGGGGRCGRRVGRSVSDSSLLAGASTVDISVWMELLYRLNDENRKRNCVK